MAFDKTTRNRLAKFVGDARDLIASEFTQQFQTLYGLSANGALTPAEQLGHLDDAGLATAALLRERVAYLVKTHPEDRDGARAAIARLAREQAFTILNRLSALRMAEKRGLVVESVGKGYQSKGFKVFEQVAGAGLGDTYHRYRRYLFCLFDELAVDLGVLFDRSSPQGLLFPREPALQALFEQLNAPDLEHLWAEDETIGWIYQYYNDPEERKQMRKESAAPRNSRELAVRNQFFTPRYVVEFLTDNTLGRIWYEMTKGQTRLKEQCRYLVRRPTEVFLAEGETAPETPEREGLSQEELLKQPVYLQHRPLKDPREIRLLDPACGSMHFGLYAFDLFETLYEEAWDNGACPALRRDYASREEFLRDVPRLIIEHNLHGIDIDPRAVQIAGLSLWLRAQKAWQTQGVRPADRPHVRRSNIVCAEPMPGSPELLDEFVATLDPPLLGELVKTVFDKMQLAGEAGSLLKIEEEIRTAIETARKEWLKQQSDLFTRKDGSQEAFFNTAEQQVIDALHAYAEQADAASYQRRLFADDAARGFAFIDLCRKRYDALVMNPPFGEPAGGSVGLLKDSYGDSSPDIDAAFVDRARDLLTRDGTLGGIYNRTQFFKGYLDAWRKRNLLEERQIDVCADLGYGVLDGAMVEAAAYTTTFHQRDRLSWFSSALSATDKQSRLLATLDAAAYGELTAESYYIHPTELSKIPASRVSYWIAQGLVDSFLHHKPLEDNFGNARQGLITSDNERFLRLTWEVPRNRIGNSASQFSDGRPSKEQESKRWCYYAKGGEYSPYYGDIHLVVLWEHDGAEIRNFFRNERIASRPQNISFYFRPAITYTERTASDFSPRAMPSGCVFDCKGPIVAAATNKVSLEALLGLLNSSIFKYFVELSLAAGDSSVSGSAARQYTQSIIGQVPVPDEITRNSCPLTTLVVRIWKAFCSIETREENSAYFVSYWPTDRCFDLSINGIAKASTKARNSSLFVILEATLQVEQIVNGLYGVEGESKTHVDKVCGTHPELFGTKRFLELPETEQRRFLENSPEKLVSELRGESGSRALTKMSHQADRQIEILAHSFETPASTIIKARTALSPNLAVDAEEAGRFISHCFGCALGRWDIRYTTGESQPPELPDPFDPLPVCPPGMLQNAEGLPAELKDVPGEYPLRISWSGILVDDENHPEDIVSRTREAIEVVWKDRAEAIEREACQFLSVRSLRDYFRRPSGFFADHLQRYSKSRRQAPIYWPLSTKSGSYALWLYYHRLTDQTLHTALADFVDPKLKAVRTELASLREAGTNRARLEELLDLESELADFRDELERIIKLPWKPNLNDGVLITASPLWPLFRLPKWQKDLKDCWQKLQEGEYDWAHLAYTLWPKRVEEVCKRDRSIAIAHGLEHLCQFALPKAKGKRGRKKKAATEEEED